MSKTEYQIVITRIDRDVPYTTEDWKQVRDEPSTPGGDDKYAYVERSILKDEETKVYEQIVSDIDMVAVINAVNKQSGGKS